MFARALLALLVLPGIFAFLIPALLVQPLGDARPAAPGLPVLTAGVVLLLWCVRDFYVVGRGTLAPWSPPPTLVSVGLYRVSRNPMYIAVLLVLGGWTLAFWSASVAVYTGVVMGAFHLRVVFGEEPWLARRY